MYIVKGFHPLKASTDRIKEVPPLDLRGGPCFMIYVDDIQGWNLFPYVLKLIVLRGGAPTFVP